jgi:hypothetical protein
MGSGGGGGVLLLLLCQGFDFRFRSHEARF